jgi:hypothetical protein
MKLADLSDGDEIVCSAYDEVFKDCLMVGYVYKVHVNPEKQNHHWIDCKRGTHNLTLHIDEEDTLLGFDRFIVKRGGWIGVDLDGTLAVYDKWRGPEHIGEPIPAMVERVLSWIAQGRDVRIFTARVTEASKNADGTEHNMARVREAIQTWCRTHLGIVLPITNVKDWNMVELWDDRAVQLIPNTGRTIAEEHEAIRAAEAGKAANAEDG